MSQATPAPRAQARASHAAIWQKYLVAAILLVMVMLRRIHHDANAAGSLVLQKSNSREARFPPHLLHMGQLQKRQPVVDSLGLAGGGGRGGSSFVFPSFVSTSSVARTERGHATVTKIGLGAAASGAHGTQGIEDDDETPVRLVYRKWLAFHGKEDSGNDERRFGVFVENYRAMDRIKKRTKETKGEGFMFGPYADWTWEEYCGDTVATLHNLNSLKVAELKDECKRRNILVGGKKADLIQRLKVALLVDPVSDDRSSGPPAVEEVEEMTMDPKAPLTVANLMGLKVRELRAACKRIGLPSSGTKAVLAGRLEAAMMAVSSTEKETVVGEESESESESELVDTDDVMGVIRVEEVPESVLEVPTMETDAQSADEDETTVDQYAAEAKTKPLEEGVSQKAYDGATTTAKDPAPDIVEVAFAALGQLWTNQTETFERNRRAEDLKRAQRAAAKRAADEETLRRTRQEVIEMRQARDRAATEAAAARERERRERQTRQEEESRKRRRQLEMEAIDAAKRAEAESRALAATVSRIRAMELEVMRDEIEKARKGGEGPITGVLVGKEEQLTSLVSGVIDQAERVLSSDKDEARGQQQDLKAEAIAAANDNAEEQAQEVLEMEGKTRDEPKEIKGVAELRSSRTRNDEFEEDTDEMSVEIKSASPRTESLDAVSIENKNIEATSNERVANVFLSLFKLPTERQEKPVDGKTEVSQTKDTEATDAGTAAAKGETRAKSEASMADVREAERKARRAKQEIKMQRRREELEVEAIASAKAEADAQAKIAERVRALEDEERRKGREMARGQQQLLKAEAIAGGNDDAEEQTEVLEMEETKRAGPKDVKEVAELRSSRTKNADFEEDTDKMSFEIKSVDTIPKEETSPRTDSLDALSLEKKIEAPSNEPLANLFFSLFKLPTGRQEKQVDGETEVRPIKDSEGADADTTAAKRDTRAKPEVSMSDAREAERKARRAKQESKIQRRREELELEAIASANVEAEAQAKIAKRIRALEEKERRKRREMLKVVKAEVIPSAVAQAEEKAAVEVGETEEPVREKPISLAESMDNSLREKKESEAPSAEPAMEIFTSLFKLPTRHKGKPTEENPEVPSPKDIDGSDPGFASSNVKIREKSEELKADAREAERKARRMKQEEEMRRRIEELEAEAITRAEAEEQAVIAERLQSLEAEEATMRRELLDAQAIGATKVQEKEQQGRKRGMEETARDKVKRLEKNSDLRQGYALPNRRKPAVAAPKQKLSPTAESQDAVSTGKIQREIPSVEPVANVFSSLFKIPAGRTLKPIEGNSDSPSTKESAEDDVGMTSSKKEIRAKSELLTVTAREAERKARRAKQEDEERRRQEELEAEAIAAAKVDLERQTKVAERIRALDEEEARRRGQALQAMEIPKKVHPKENAPVVDDAQPREKPRFEPSSTAESMENIPSTGMESVLSAVSSLFKFPTGRKMKPSEDKTEIPLSKERDRDVVGMAESTIETPQKPEKLAAREAKRKARRAKQEEEMRKRLEELEVEAIAAAKAQEEEQSFIAARVRALEQEARRRP